MYLGVVEVGEHEPMPEAEESSEQEQLEAEEMGSTEVAVILELNESLVTRGGRVSPIGWDRFSMFGAMRCELERPGSAMLTEDVLAGGGGACLGAVNELSSNIDIGLRNASLEGREDRSGRRPPNKGPKCKSGSWTRSYSEALLGAGPIILGAKLECLGERCWTTLVGEVNCLV
jgi:hypothetical protein